MIYVYRMQQRFYDMNFKLRKLLNLRFVFTAWVLLTMSLGLSGQGRMLWQETFDHYGDTLPAHWWSEGVPATVVDGRLFVDADTVAPRVSTIWLDKEFEGNLAIEFDVHVVSSEEVANNLNFFLCYSDPGDRHLKETREMRNDGGYGHYHKLNGYIFTHLANGTEELARFRFRYNPGFTLVQEKYTYECKKGVTYRIRIVKIGNRIQYWANGNLILNSEVDENQLYKRGIIGFRTFRTALWWDNLTVTQLE